jgi:hypothetical protein
MRTQEFEITAIYLVAGLIGGVYGGEAAFPQLETSLGTTVAPLVLGLGGLTASAIAYEVVGALRQRHSSIGSKRSG